MKRCVGPQVMVGECGDCGVPSLVIHVHSASQLEAVLSRSAFYPQVGPRTRARLERERVRFVEERAALEAR